MFNKIKSVREIIDGEKIRWTYLKANPMNISELALKGYDDPNIIVDIVKQYIDHDKILAQIEINRKKPVKQSKLQEKIQAMQEANQKVQDLKNKTKK